MMALQLLLFLGAVVGHAALWVFVLNWLYGQPLPHRFLHLLRPLHTLIVLAGPILFWLVYGLDLTKALEPPTESGGRLVLGAYVLVCWTLGFGLMPATTLRRLLRGRPGLLLSNHTKTVNVAAELGHAPVGRGKHRRLARLPGNEVFRVDFSERIFRLPALPPAWDGLTILHLSDLHLCGTPDRDFYRFVMDRCRAWESDLVALTGDFVDSVEHHRWIIPVLGRLRWRIGAFAVLGNHDAWYEPQRVRRRIERLGIQVLGNTWQQIQVREEPLVLIGHEGPWFRPAPDLSACPPGVFRLCLSHTPDNIRWAQRHDVALMLAGHNHGGQIRFPLIGSVFVPSRYSRRYDCGTFHEPPTLLHVSRGLGGQEPLRYNCRPEVTLIVLRKSEGFSLLKSRFATL
jgi:predicted MPP superfamily phosphohydrolase